MKQTRLTDAGGSPAVAETNAAEAVAGDGGQAATVVDLDDERFPPVDEAIDVAVTQVDYTIVGNGRDERPIVHVFGRRPDDDGTGPAVHVRVHDFEPYFYTPTEAVTDEKLDQDVITRTEEGYTGIREEELTKVCARTPRDVGRIREEFDHFEADILFPNRLLIDKDIKSGIRVPDRRASAGSVADAPSDTPDDDGDGGGDANNERIVIDVHHEEVSPTEADASPRVLTFDIEVDDRSGFPEEGEEAILCLTSHDSGTDEYVAWICDAPDGDGRIPDELDEYESIGEAGIDIAVRAFDSEEGMLDAFLTYVERTDPDITTGWNFDDFDAPYLIDRLDTLNGASADAAGAVSATDEENGGVDLDYERLSRVGEVWTGGWGGPDVKGRVVFDLLYAYQRTQFSELDSYRLDAVGEVELGVGKERYPGSIGGLWEDDPEQLLEYNLRDVELCVEIDRGQDVITFWREVAAFAGCKLEDAPTPGDVVDMYVLHEVHGEFVLPSKGRQDAEEYEGGAVFDPITGVRENVAVLDLASLYPMSMVTINASPETKVDPEAYDGETYRAPNGTHFRKEPSGIIREMVDDLLAERERFKELRSDREHGSSEYRRYDRQQGAVKRVMNCFTPDTEVLTPDGVRGITDLDVGDEVYSLDPERMVMEVKPVTETHAYPDYRGELVDFETRKTDFRVTPNHRMCLRKNDRNGIVEDEYRFVEAGDLYDSCNYELPHDWTTNYGETLESIDLTALIDGEYEVWVQPSVHGHTFRAELGWQPRRVKKSDIGQTGYVFTAEEFEEHRAYIESVCERSYVRRESSRKWVPRTYDGDDFLDLLAWYVTGGNVYTSEPKQFTGGFRGSATSVKVAQNAPVADGGTGPYADIGDLLDRMGFDYFVDDRSYTFTSKLLGDLLEDLCGSGSFEKRLPDLVRNADERQKERFLETLVAGDGDRQVGSWRYTMSSDRLRDDVLELCAHLGLTAGYNRDSGSWRIYVTEDGKNTLRPYRSGSRSTAEDGVYCVTVADNHTLLAGRNGKFQWIGQSLYGVAGWDRFRLYDKEFGAAVTATGRAVLEFTEEAANDFGHQVAYGDTDSVMLELGQDVAVDEAVESAQEIATHINGSYDAFASEKLGAAEHRFEIEFEKLYRRFFQAGKKKRYAGHVIWKDGREIDDVDITGFEYKRSDIASITKRVQLEVIERIVYGDDLGEVSDYVHDEIERFESGEIGESIEDREAFLREIGIPGGIGKRLDAYDIDRAQIRGAKYANLLLGTNFQRGSKPKLLYLERVHPQFFDRIEDERADAIADHRDLFNEFRREQDVICFEYPDQIPEEFVIDREKMLGRTLEKPISRVLEALDISWNEVKSGQTQTGFDSFV